MKSLPADKILLSLAVAALVVIIAIALLGHENQYHPTQHDFREACRNHNGVRVPDEQHLVCLDGATPDIPFNR